MNRLGLWQGIEDRTPARTALLGVAVFGALATGCAGSADRSDCAPLAYELLGVAPIQTTHPMTGKPVGGLSGLAYDPVAESWLVVSDQPGEPVAYTLRTSFDPREQSDGLAWVAGPFEAWLGRDWPVPSVSSDAEGVAIRRRASGVHERLWVYEKPPAIAREDMRTLESDSLTVPDEVSAHARTNRAFEAAAILPDLYGDELWVGMEAPLATDGAESDRERGGVSRVLVYRVDSGEMLRTVAYRSEPLPEDFASGAAGSAAENALVGFGSLPDAGPRNPKLLLALERGFQPGSGNRAKIFVLDGTVRDDPETDLPVLAKRLVVDFADLDLAPWGLTHTENVEGIAIGPRIADRRGGRLVLVVTDDNFGRNDQKQIVYAFRVHLGR